MNRPPLRVRPNPIVAGLRPYSPGRLEYDIDLWLDANESLRPAPGLEGAFAKVADLQRYPATQKLEACIAAGHDVEADAVLVTAGADDALERAIRAVCSPGRRAALTRPSFTMLRRYARLAGAEVEEIPWWAGDYPVDSVCERAGDDTAVVTVVSPNNPTGAAISAEALVTLARKLPNTLILLDHAYVEFASEDLTRLALEHSNVVVFRTFSKAWGAAGLRVGYAIGDSRVVRWMRCVGQPYSVSRPSIAVATALTETATVPAQRIEQILTQRKRLDRLLREIGVETLPSQANFILARPKDAETLRRGLGSLGISVRGFAGDGELSEWLRITVPGEVEAFDRLEAAIRTVLEPEALLFDLDGVLADVSGSYRKAILETAASYGVELTSKDIAEAKAVGDANNDWCLTRRLLAERGINRSLAEITRTFEALYQGDDEQPGLRRHERLMLPVTVLEALAEQRKLAIVTGRPRADAQRFLDEHGIRDVFTAVVTMEDGPAKPNPAPLHLALERLGVRHAWMLGDTPDDLRAARDAGVVPIGVVAPREEISTARSILEGAGAARVLEHINLLEEVLP